MIEFDKDGRPVWEFSGKHLLRGETDGSSYPSGGLRATHTAAAYLTIDASSPIFLRGDVIFIPSCMISFSGHSIDEKVPMLRAGDALSREGVRLLGHLGYHAKKLNTMIGLEQELFLIPRQQYLMRPDLQLAGRTVLGRQPPRGQEMSDHYMAPPSFASPALAAMQEIQHECYKVGIPLKTRHREVAPNQYEFAPLYGTVTTQIDQNLTVMQIIDEVSAKHGLATLFAEKPFQGVNGSGKHNNWSIATEDGTNLLNVQQLAKNANNPHIFPIIMSAIVKAVSKHGDLMRLAIASPGNDFRLGACEAPPAIMSMYLGEDMTKYMEAFMNGNHTPYVPSVRTLSLGVSNMAKIEIPAEDRNRTSPFPYGGHRFEFRAVGSSQNVSLVNTVLATIVADSFRELSEAIEANPGRPALDVAQEVAQQMLKENWKVIFNGNGYDPANQAMLTERGVWRIDSGVDAMCQFSTEKNINLFTSNGVLTKEECVARQNVMLGHYVGLVEIEAGCMIDMIQQHVIPSVKSACVGPLAELQADLDRLKNALAELHHIDDLPERAQKARVLRLETMVDIRKHTDIAEEVVPPALWTLATYKELLFMDQHA